VSLSENIEGSVELNQNTLCVHGLSKGYNTGITEQIHLENSRMIREMIKKAILACYQFYYSYHRYCYQTTPFTVLRGN